MINPKPLHGPWATGYALHVHSTGSEFLGYDQYGHEQFDTKRTEVGELLYRVKYKGDDAALDELVRLHEAVCRRSDSARHGPTGPHTVPGTR